MGVTVAEGGAAAGELARVNSLLDDPVFLAPFVPFFPLTAGRPSTPVECYLRTMFLKLARTPTVLPANVGYRTDSGLLAKAVLRIAVMGRRIQAAGGATRNPEPGTGPQPLSRQAGTRDRLETEAARRAAPRRNAGHGDADHLGTRRSGRPGRGRCQAATG